MNFKTTLILIVLLAAAGVALFFARDRAATETASTEIETTAGNLLDVNAEDVTKVAVTPADGERIVLEKADATWRLVEPVTAPADSFEVDGLVRAVVELESRGRVEGSEGQSDATGLDEPSFRIELTTKDGQSHTLNVGQRSGVGGNVYVAPGDGSNVHLASADVWEKLQAPARQYRRKNLVDTPTTEIRQVTITRPDQPRLVMHRSGETWRLVEPEPMPLEKTEVDDLLFGLSGLRAEEFVDDGADNPTMYQLDQPQVTVVASTEPPATQPAAATQSATAATTRPAGTTLKIGRYADLRRQGVFVSVENAAGTTIAKVPAGVVETFDVTPLDLRDRKVLDVTPEQVTAVRITSELPATTQPTTREASRREVVLAKRVEATTAPATTMPATAQASAQPSTQPSPKWVIASAGDAAADEGKVTALLRALHPLRATRYVESTATTTATTQPADTHVLMVTTGGLGGAPVAEHVIRIVDRGGSEPPLATYDDLSFELDRSVLSNLTADFTTPSSPTPSVPGFPQNVD